MEDILIQVLCLCSVETLVWIQCDNTRVLGISTKILRWLLHKNLEVIAATNRVESSTVLELINTLNKRDICTPVVSDKYRLCHFKKYFLYEQFIKRCARNGLYDFITTWIKRENINLENNYWLNCTVQAFSPDINYNDEMLNDIFLYAIKHSRSLDTLSIHSVDSFNLMAAIILQQRWDLVNYAGHEHSIFQISIMTGNYDIFANPDKYIPETYRYLFKDEVNNFYLIAQSKPKLLSNFSLSKDKIRKLFGSLSTYTRSHDHCRSVVKYLLANDLWKEFRFKKEEYLLFTQLHDRKDVDIDRVVLLFESKQLQVRQHWVIYALIEWYDVPKERLSKVIYRASKKDSIYGSYLKSIFNE